MNKAFVLTAFAAALLSACAATVQPERFAVADIPGADAQIVDGYDRAVKRVTAKVEETLRSQAPGFGTCKVEVNNVPDPHTFERSIRTDCFGGVGFDTAVLDIARRANDLQVPRFRFIVSTPQYRGALNWKVKAGRTTIAYYLDVPADTQLSYGEPYEAEGAHERATPPVVAPTTEPRPLAARSPQQAVASFSPTPSQAPSGPSIYVPPPPADLRSEPAGAPVELPRPMAAAAPYSSPQRTAAYVERPSRAYSPSLTPLSSWVTTKGKQGWTLSVFSSGQPITAAQAARFNATELITARHNRPSPQPYALLLPPAATEEAAISEWQRVTGNYNQRPAAAYELFRLMEAGVQ